VLPDIPRRRLLGYDLSAGRRKEQPGESCNYGISLYLKTEQIRLWIARSVSLMPFLVPFVAAHVATDLVALAA
jgi:hypothetical protein